MKRFIRSKKTISRMILVATAGVAFGEKSAEAQTSQWTVETGNWTNENNWSPQGVPGLGDHVLLTAANGLAFNCGYDYAGPAIELTSLVVDLTNSSSTSIEASLEISGDTKLICGSETIGHAGSGSIAQSAGTNQTTDLAGNLILGGQPGAVGNYSLAGTGTLSVFASEILGQFGTGIFSQSAGSNTVGGLLQLSAAVASEGVYTLDGGSLTTFGEQVGLYGVGGFAQFSGSNLNIGGYGLVIGGSGGTYNEIGGSAIVNGPLAVNANGTLTIGGGSMSISATATVNSGGRINLNGGSFSADNLSISGSGIVNVNSAIAIDFGSSSNDPEATILTYLQSGYAAGSWSGTAGIVSTSAAGSVSPVLSVGYADGNIDSGTAAASNQVLVKLTLAGDANLDGNVDFNDLFAIGKHLNTTGNDWADGNFNYSLAGVVDFNDLFIIGQNLNKTINAAAAQLGGTTTSVAGIGDVDAVPEPFAAGWFLLASSVLARGRRKRRK